MANANLQEIHVCNVIGCVARYIEALNKRNAKDAQIFKDLLTKEMQLQINETARTSPTKRKRN